jgi:hypothetical protein
MAKKVVGKSIKAIKEWELEIAKLNRQIGELNKQGLTNKQVLDKVGGSITKLTRDTKRLEVTTKNYYDNSKKGAQAIANVKTRTDKLKAGLNKLTTTYGKLTKETKGSTGALKSSGSAVGKFAGGVQSAIGTLARFGTAAGILGLATKALKFIFVDSAKAFIEFEKSVKNLSAVAGVSGSALKELETSALDIAGQTKFTAIEVVQLQTELSKLGFSANEVTKATGPVAFAAQALGASISTTAEQVGKLINQFSLLAEDSDEIADTLVTTINNSALSLQSFGVAIQYIGPISSGLGFSLQETAGAMAALADSGFTASRVGTGLRAIFTELGSTTADVKGELKNLAAQQISLAEAADLVGKRNAAQLITLLENIDVLGDSEDAYYSQGRALQAAGTQITSFSGQMDILRSEINRAQVSFGEFVIGLVPVTYAIGLISRDARRTIEGFKALNDISSDDLQEDLQRLANGADEGRVALERLASQAGMSIDEYIDSMQSGTFWNKVFIDSIVELAGPFKELLRSFLYANGLIPKEIQAVQGLTEAYKKQADAIRDNLLIEKQREIVDEEFQDRLQKLITLQLQGIDVEKEADETARAIIKERVNLRKAIEEYNAQLKNTNELTEQEIQDLRDGKLRLEAREKALASYGQRFANFIGLLEDEAEIERRKADNFRKEVQDQEAKNKGLERAGDILLATNEANKKFMENSIEQFKIDQGIIRSNLDFIAGLENKKAGIQALNEEEDKSTKQGEYNIKINNKEIETLDNIIARYKAKNEALGENAGTLGLVVKNTEKQLSSLKSQYDKGEITGSRLKQLGEKAYEDMVGQLLLLAGDDEDLRKLANAIAENFPKPGEIRWDEILNTGIKEAISTTVGALDEFNKVAFENTKNRLEAEKDALKARYETEDFLAKQQFENGLINESQFRRRQAALRKKQVAEENAIDKKLFEAEQKRKKNEAKVDFLEAVASIIPTLIKEGIAEPTTLNIMAAITAASAAASYAAEVSAIGQAKFYPKKFAEGGMVDGPSHSQGGVPFTVQGQGGYEMEGGEFIVNKRAASLHRDLLDKINGSVKPNITNQPMKYADGGIVNSKNITNVNQQSLESVNYLKAIAEATTTNAINSSRPVRAFVSSKDLRQDESARRIKDNNTTI